MKIINKKAFAGFITIFFIAGIGKGFAAENIELPEITTVISGETEKAGEEALPDFSDVLKLPVGSGGVEPVLPEVETTDNTDIAVGKEKPVEKSVYAEGLIGGGYPAFFTGNMSVFRTVGASPFKFSFEHESALCYAMHSFTDGFSDRTTRLSLEKTYSKNHIEWGLYGSYKSAADGLQGNIVQDGKPGLLNHDLYNAGGEIFYSFDNGFSAGTKAETWFYNRYAEIACPQIKTVAFFSVNPELLLRWQGNGFEAGFTTDYDFDGELSQNITYPKSHRVRFMLDFQWKNDFIRLYGNAAAIVGQNIMENPVIVPFTVGIESAFPVYFSNRRVSICAEGGIDSYKPKSFELEEKYKFTRLDWNPEEISEWYGRLNFSIPLKASFTGSAGIEYRQTAYENKRWNPSYNEINSIYGYLQKDFRGLSTDFTLAFHQGIFSISGNWHSNWLDVPANDFFQTVKLDVCFEDENSKWGADVNCLLNISDEMKTPLLNAEGFVRITPSVRTILSVNDIIKLYKGETRKYAGKYEARGGSVSLLLKFFF